MTEEKKGTAIIADDEMHSRMMMKVALREMGFDVVAEAANGVEAVSGYKEHHPDIIFLDYNMPVMTGRQALQKIIAEEVPAIFLFNPTYTYPQSKKIKGFDTKKIIKPSNRFNQISDWYIKTSRQWEATNY